MNSDSLSNQMEFVLVGLLQDSLMGSVIADIMVSIIAYCYHIPLRHVTCVVDVDFFFSSASAGKGL